MQIRIAILRNSFIKIDDEHLENSKNSFFNYGLIIQVFILVLNRTKF